MKFGPPPPGGGGTKKFGIKCQFFFTRNVEIFVIFCNLCLDKNMGGALFKDNMVCMCDLRMR